MDHGEGHAVAMVAGGALSYVGRELVPDERPRLKRWLTVGGGALALGGALVCLAQFARGFAARRRKRR
jgi:hypothetical protein